MIKIFKFLIIVLCFYSCNHSNELVNDSKELNKIVDKYIENGSQALLLVRLEDKKGKTIYQYGKKNNDLIPDNEINESTWFRIWSMSKIVTISLTLDLIEDGILKLDDPVIKYIPEFKGISFTISTTF